MAKVLIGFHKVWSCHLSLVTCRRCQEKGHVSGNTRSYFVVRMSTWLYRVVLSRTYRGRVNVEYCLYTRTYTYGVFMCAYFVRAHKYAYSLVHSHVRAHKYAYTHVHTRTRTYAHINTRTHTYTHTYVYRVSLSSILMHRQPSG